MNRIPESPFLWTLIVRVLRRSSREPRIDYRTRRSRDVHILSVAEWWRWYDRAGGSRTDAQRSTVNFVSPLLYAQPGPAAHVRAGFPLLDTAVGLLSSSPQRRWELSAQLPVWFAQCAFPDRRVRLLARRSEKVRIRSLQEARISTSLTGIWLWYTVQVQISLRAGE